MKTISIHASNSFISFAEDMLPIEIDADAVTHMQDYQNLRSILLSDLRTSSR